MRLKQQISARLAVAVAAAVSAGLFASGRQVFASEQQAPQTPSVQAPAAQPGGPELQLSADEAVRLALENNMSIQTERLSPQVQALALVRANAAYAPTFASSFSRSANTSPPTDFLSAGVATTTSGNLITEGGLQQRLRWGGGSYSLSMSGGRSTSDAPRVVFSPQLSSRLNASYSQPLLRDFKIDAFRQQLLQSRNQLEIADIQLAARITQTSRNVRIAYYNLVGALGALDVARQSLELARESLRHNERRVEVGTMAQIDILEAQAEVSRQEESVIIAEANIRAAEDNLRTLVMNPSQPDFWSVRLVPTERPNVTPQVVDVDAAIANALKNRTDLAQIRKQLENVDISIRFAENQKLPALSLDARYGLSGVGGTQQRWSTDLDNPVILNRTQRSFGDVLRDVLGNEFRNWGVSVNFSYPLGTSQADATLAQSRVQRQQATLQLREQEMSIAAQVRDAGRQVMTSQQRVEATRKAREFAERRLEAEQKRVNVGLSTTFQLFQAQRDLDNARQSELRALIDYNRALVNFEAVQIAPVGGGF
ncbi:MAG TPA: TolC family protein [Vicinamibacterales bacterium]|nr:TolC family protein [Vicinamibacterales bacterium]